MKLRIFFNKNNVEQNIIAKTIKIEVFMVHKQTGEPTLTKGRHKWTLGIAKTEAATVDNHWENKWIKFLTVSF